MEDNNKKKAPFKPVPKNINFIDLEHEMLEVINSMTKGETLKERFYSSYIQLGIASYTLENWCTSVASFERARRISEIHNFTFPNNFDSAIEYAKSQMEIVK